MTARFLSVCFVHISNLAVFQYGGLNYQIIGPLECCVGIQYHSNGSDYQTYSNAPVSGVNYSGRVNLQSFVPYQNKLYRVSKTSEFCFRACSKITSVSLPSSLEFIARDTFYQTSIKKLHIPYSVKYLDFAAFSGMMYLEVLTFEPSANITFLSNNTFSNCRKLNKIIFPMYVTFYESRMFGISNFSQIYICSNSAPETGSNVFSNAFNVSPTIYVRKEFQGTTFFDLAVNIMPDESICMVSQLQTKVCRSVCNNAYHAHAFILICMVFIIM